MIIVQICFTLTTDPDLYLSRSKQHVSLRLYLQVNASRAQPGLFHATPRHMLYMGLGIEDVPVESI